MVMRPQVLLRFGLWYALNVAYNITNKLALEHVRIFVEGATAAEVVGQASASSLSLPFTIGSLQFGVGALYSIILWVSGCRRPVPHATEVSSAISRCIERARDLCQITTRIGRVVDHRGFIPGRQPRRQSNDYTPLATKTHTHNDHQHADDIEHDDNTENLRPTHVALHDESSLNIELLHTVHIALHHTLGQLCTVICLTYNSIGFAHVIKAMEPLFSALASFFILGQIMDIRVYASLIPVVGGVVLACAGSHEFVWISFWSGMGSNAFFAVRGVLSKLAMESGGGGSQSRHHHHQHLSTSPKHEMIELSAIPDNKRIDGKDKMTIKMEQSPDENDHAHNDAIIQETPSSPGMSAANLFSAVTCMSFILSFPLALIFEGKILYELASNATQDISNEPRNENETKTIIIYIFISGLLHYLNNEVMYLVLSNVHPITLAVGNTMKRVFIIVAGVLVFATPVSLQTGIGSVIAIGGVFLYGMMKQRYGSSTRGSGAIGHGVCGAKVN